MQIQTYKQMRVGPNRATLAALLTESGSAAPVGEITYEIQNATGGGLLYVSFGDQANVPQYSGSPLPLYWKREQTCSADNIYLETSGGDVWVSVATYT